MDTTELAQLRRYVARIAQVPERNVELIHGTNQDAHDVPAYIDVYTGDLTDHQTAAQSRLAAAGIGYQTHGSVLSLLTSDVEIAWRNASH